MNNHLARSGALRYFYRSSIIALFYLIASFSLLPRNLQRFWRASARTLPIEETIRFFNSAKLQKRVLWTLYVTNPHKMNWGGARPAEVPCQIVRPLLPTDKSSNCYPIKCELHDSSVAMIHLVETKFSVIDVDQLGGSSRGISSDSSLRWLLARQGSMALEVRLLTLLPEHIPFTISQLFPILMWVFRCSNSSVVFVEFPI